MVNYQVNQKTYKYNKKEIHPKKEINLNIHVLNSFKMTITSLRKDHQN